MGIVSLDFCLESIFVRGVLTIALLFIKSGLGDRKGTGLLECLLAYRKLGLLDILNI
jgi:hypothetical protein